MLQHVRSTYPIYFTRRFNMNATTAWEQFKWGIFVGMGLIVAYGVLKLLVMIIGLILSGAGHLEAPKL